MSLKHSLRELALSGAAPAFAQPKHVGQPNIGNRKQLLQRFKEMIDRRYLTNNGPFVRAFEQGIAAKMQVKHCIVANNATVALQLAVRALKLSGEIILPSFTFIATAHAVAWEGMRPVFCDIDRTSHTIDPRRIESLITDRTSAILGVHTWGNACDIDAIETIARKHNLRVLYDGAHAMGCSYRGQMLGRFGDAEVLSFHATKALNSFEGGAILTNNSALADDLRLMRNFGFAGTDQVTLLGINAKMCEACGVMGLTSLEGFERFCARNRRNYDAYRKGLGGIPGVRLHPYDARESHNRHYIIVECDNGPQSLSRDDLVRFLETENVLARRYFYPGCHKMEPYSSAEPGASLRLANTEWLTARVMALPNGTAVSRADIRKICGLIQIAQETRIGSARVYCNLPQEERPCDRMSSLKPRISVLVLTYNHERYLAEALTGLQQQQVNFPFELVVADDCSSDGTAAIVESWRDVFGERMRILPRPRNLGITGNFVNALSECRGRYLAILEGDDYWTDRAKLQKQHDFLSANPDVSACFHRVRLLFDDFRFGDWTPLPGTKARLEFLDVLVENFVPNCSSLMFRNDADLKIPAWIGEIGSYDWVLHVANAERGGLAFMDDAMSVYRVHSGGAWSGKTVREQVDSVCDLLDHLNGHYDRRFDRLIRAHQRSWQYLLKIRLLEQEIQSLNAAKPGASPLSARIVSRARETLKQLARRTRRKVA